MHGSEKNENQLVYKGQDKSHDLWFHADVETGESRALIRACFLLSLHRPSLVHSLTDKVVTVSPWQHWPSIMTTHSDGY